MNRRSTSSEAVLGMVLCAACSTIPGANAWETTSLKKQAAADLGCDSEALATYEAGDNQYSVRGCGKRARYVRTSCNRVDRSCVFSRSGDVVADQSPQATQGSGNPADVTIPAQGQ
jgi:hypothetical protein